MTFSAHDGPEFLPLFRSAHMAADAVVMIYSSYFLQVDVLEAFELEGHSFGGLRLGSEASRNRLRFAFFLVKASEPQLQAISPLEAVARCLKGSLVHGFHSANADERREMLERLVRLFRRTPAYVLRFAKDDRFWSVIDDLERERSESAKP